MKLTEIIKVPPQLSAGFDTNMFDIGHAVQVTTAENIPVFHIQGGEKDPSLHMYALKINNQIVSMVIGAWGTFNSTPALFIRRTYTKPQHRNKGLVTSLYNALYSKLKYVIVSDFEMSPETITVWTKLSQTLPVKVVDIASRQIRPFSDVPPEQIFNGDRNVRLVLECTPSADWIVIPESSEGILQDYLNYTHPENVGKYI